MIEYLHFCTLQVNLIVQKCQQCQQIAAWCQDGNCMWARSRKPEPSFCGPNPSPRHRLQAALLARVLTNKDINYIGIYCSWSCQYEKLNRHFVWQSGDGRWIPQDQSPTTAKMCFHVLLLHDVGISIHLERSFVLHSEVWQYQNDLSYPMLSKHLAPNT